MSQENDEAGEVAREVPAGDIEEHAGSTHGPRPSLASCVGTVITLTTKGFGTGERARLRSTRPEAPYTGALWRVLVALDERWTDTESMERRWSAYLRAMMHLHGTHERGAYLGRVLARHGFPEHSLERLLSWEPHDVELEDELGRMARFVSNKNTTLDWVEVAGLLFFDGPLATRHRTRIARDYYRALHTTNA